MKSSKIRNTITNFPKLNFKTLVAKLFQIWWVNFYLGEVNENCVPFSNFVNYAYDLVLRTTAGSKEQKKSCPNVIIRTLQAVDNQNFRKMRVFLSKEHSYKKVSTEKAISKITGVVKCWVKPRWRLFSFILKSIIILH